MRQIFATLLFVAAAATIANAGIEVLGIEVLQNGNRGIEVLCTDCPPGSHAEYVRIVNGIEVLMDADQVDPATGRAFLETPQIVSGDFIRLVGPDNVVYGIEVL